MVRDKELMEKLQQIWHSARPFPQVPWDQIIALVRENDAAIPQSAEPPSTASIHAR